MSDDVRRTPPWAKKDEAPAADAPVEPAADVPTEAPAESPAPAAPADEATVGTGSVIALGCIAGTLVLILIGLIFIGINALI